ncbi:thaumatin-like protein 1 [Cajanus cajan]|nr:thaumatin-like protein 1 [Cajanus cajan]
MDVGAYTSTFTITNNCAFTIWPATLTGGGTSQLPSTGFELTPKASFNLDVPPLWSGRFWARTHCSTDSHGRFTCATGDCGSHQVPCNGAGGTPPVSLVELSLAPNKEGLDFYDVSLVDGFNLAVSVAPEGCNTTSCPADVNRICPPNFAVKGSDGSVIACKSACLALEQPEYCCTGPFASADKCSPTPYSIVFKNQCPQAYSYAYDDRSSTFTCSGGANYHITFCP